VTFGGWGDADEAKRFIREAIERAKQRSTQA
jgi:inorganic pyrophosphatase